MPEYRILVAVSAAREYEGLAELIESLSPLPRKQIGSRVEEGEHPTVGIGAPKTPRDWQMARGVEFRMVSPELHR